MSKSRQPRPPKDLSDEARAEWKRVCGELDAAGRLDKSDRAVLVLYVTTWSIYAAAMQHVNKHGPIVKWPNGLTGPSPYHKASRDLANQLRALLNDMGLTFASRPKSITPAAGDLTF